MFLSDWISKFGEIYNNIMPILPWWGQDFVKLFILVCLVFSYAFFIWKFHKFLARKNIFGFNLMQYTGERDMLFVRVLRGFFYLCEYIILLPFIIFFWFSILCLFLMFMTDISVSSILLISAVIVIVTRMAAYLKKGDLAKELAKLIPLNLLAVTILTTDFFNFQRVASQFAMLPEFFSKALAYWVFIVILEIILRTFDFIFSLFGRD